MEVNNQNTAWWIVFTILLFTTHLHANDDIRQLPVDSLISLAYNQFNKDLNQGIYYADLAVDKSSALGLHDREVDALITKGMLQYYASDIDAALHTLNRSDSLLHVHAKTENYPVQMGRLDYFRGRLYMLLNYNDLALDALINSLDNLSIAKDSSKLSKIMELLGTFYSSQEDLTKGVSYYHKAYSINEAMGSGDQLSILCNLCQSYAELEQVSSAVQYCTKAVQECQSANDSFMLAYALCNQAIHFAQTEKTIPKAINGFQQSIALATKYDDQYLLVDNYYQLAKCYNTIGDIPSSQNALESAMRISEELDLSDYKLKIYTVFIDNYEAIQQPRNVNAYLKKSIALEREIDQKTNQSKVEELTIQYNLKEKNLQLAKLQQENALKQLTISNSRNILFGLSFGLFIVTLLAFWIYRYWKRQVVIEKELADTQRSALKAEFNLERTNAYSEGISAERKRLAMELHDHIGGSLSAYKLKVYNKQSKDELDVLDNIISDVRKISHDLAADDLSHASFNQLITYRANELLNLEGLTLNIIFHPLDAWNTLDENIQIQLFHVVTEALQNIRKHAEAKSVDLAFTKDENNTITVLIEDDGKGINTDTVSKTGIGLNNIRRRIEQLNGTLTIDSAIGRGTILTIQLKAND